MKVLIVEDDAEGAAFLAHGIAERGHEADVARNGRDGLVMATGPQRYDVVIVDRMLPELDGLSLVKAMRAAGSAIPTLFLTSLSGIDDRVEGLEAGGDDYLVKPFALAELSARLEALLRRPVQPQRITLRLGPLELDRVRREAWRGGRKLDLLPREFQLLDYMAQHEGQVVTRAMLLEDVWNYRFTPQTNLVDVHMGRLRRKLDTPDEPPLICSIRGAGFCLRAPA